MSTTSSTTIRSQLGPLTTTFTQPSGCSSILWYDYSDGWYGYPANTLQCRLEKYSTSGSISSSVFKRGILPETCFPSGFASYANQWTATDPLAPPSPDWTAHFFSPGLICPVGYTTACAVARQTDLPLPPGAPGGIWSLLSPGETAVGCCPSGYDCNDAADGCYSTAQQGATITGKISKCRSGSTTTLPTTTSVVTTPTAVAYADIIRLAQRKSDVSNATRGSHGGLSTGAYAGIGVGCGIVLLFLVGLPIFLLLRRRRRRRQAEATATENQQQHPANGISIPEVEQTCSPQAESKSELDSRHLRMTPFEATQVGAELPSTGWGTAAPSEVDGNSPLQMQRLYNWVDAQELASPIAELPGDDGTTHHRPK